MRKIRMFIGVFSLFLSMPAMEEIKMQKLAIENPVGFSRRIQQLKNEYATLKFMITKVINDTPYDLWIYSSGDNFLLPSQQVKNVCWWNPSSSKKPKHRNERLLGIADHLCFGISEFDVLACDLSDDEYFERGCVGSVNAVVTLDDQVPLDQATILATFVYNQIDYYYSDCQSSSFNRFKVDDSTDYFIKLVIAIHELDYHIDGYRCRFVCSCMPESLLEEEVMALYMSKFD